MICSKCFVSVHSTTSIYVRCTWDKGAHQQVFYTIVSIQKLLYVTCSYIIPIAMNTPILYNSSSTRFLCLFDFPSSFFPTHLLLSILSMVVPIYNAELAPRTHRGRLVSLNQLAITAGIMVSFLVDLLAAMYYSGWRVALGVQCLFGLVFTFGMVFLPETPR